MPLSVQTLIHHLETLAPKRLAFDWDNVGLQVGSPHGTVNKILVTLDVNDCVLSEAKEMGVDFIVTHHPFIFRPLSAVRTDLPQGAMIERAIKDNIRVYAAHTNLDVAVGGVNDALAERLGLSDAEILRPSGFEELEKVTVFVPRGHEDSVRDAMAAAGAGWIGNYSHCSFQAAGTGTFLPREGTDPYIGSQGELERVEELRLETICPAHLRNRVVTAMQKAHPYEEAAYDIYPLKNAGKPYGLGRVGKIDPCTLEHFCALVKERLQVSTLRVTGDPERIIQKVAVCGGSGGDLIHAATFAGADVLVTGDLKYHEACDCSAIGLSLIDAGHDATERVIVPVLADWLQKRIVEDGHSADVLCSTLDTAPWRVI